MLRRFIVGAGCLAVVLACAWAVAIDKRPTSSRSPQQPYWPQWRGPNRDDISPDKGLLQQWPEGGPPLVWQVDGLGGGFSSVSIADGRILTMGNRDDAQWVFALELDGGKEIWKSRVGDKSTNSYPGTRCTPTIDGAFVYAISSNGDLACLNFSDGAPVWSVNFARDFDGKMHSGWGYSESPLVDGDKVVCTPGGPEAGIVALNKRSGELIWKCAIPDLGSNGTDGAGYSSIVIGKGAGIKQYVQLMGRGVVGIAADNGKFLWGYNRVANRTANIPTPLVHENYVFCSTGYQTGAALLELKRAGRGVEAKEIYFQKGKELQNHHGGMIMLGDYVYLGHGHNNGAPTCIEWKTGNVAWRENHGPGTGTAHITYADNQLYFRYENGVMALIAAEPEKYVVNGKFDIPGGKTPSWAHPVVIGGKLYLRDQERLLCFNVADPSAKPAAEETPAKAGKKRK